ncbi:hypothetical protein J2Y45_003082 [Dyadobacter sp. BE34]|uniref:Uncharacterized protein n=1 Tax=Dyadobacter fermentans TaxID=94254 RepID=A0ABU1QWD0_9BACT|nr:MULTISPECIES: hypothetical protein [Dyadobacter]MDR6804610.1 hypothetical protein [Dyadobacter fermentans]MDR7043631.1 hypothetical protein [Dyadobacter sp. BE242]MDR7197943.1 hypothetical protein [Dyadobacter sp. BE34]MDR7214624.1 hypothetical protein [Dyadobacter sp. BE31]MDR7262159.1 hypothetical protein [Dyadobacter sp. BE32]
MKKTTAINGGLLLFEFLHIYRKTIDMEKISMTSEKELYYSALIEQIKTRVPESTAERDQFLEELKSLISEDESEVSFKNKVDILHTLAMYCGSYWITILPYCVELEP